MDGHAAAYHYTEVGIFILEPAVFAYDDFKPGAILTLEPEPENTYDPRAVRLMLGDRRVGYLYRGSHQDMANDWFDDGLPMFARLTSLASGNQRAEITLVFYRNPSNSK